MRANVARSEEHVAKQEAIITRLTKQGHEALAADAQALLAVMNAHLAIEIKLLARMRDRWA
jgi:hypothetical protein